MTQENLIYDDNVKIYQSCVQLLSEKNLLLFRSIDLDSNMYRDTVPPKDATSTVYWHNEYGSSILIVGMACSTLRDSLVTIHQQFGQLIRCENIRMAMMALSNWQNPDNQDMSVMWPMGWLMKSRDRLDITIKWNGKEKPCCLDVAFMMMRY